MLKSLDIMSPDDRKREFAVEVVARLKAAGYQALWAGGCVRDFLLGRAPQDYDVATDARPEEVRRLFGHRRTLAVGASFGVIIVRGPKAAGHVEVTTFRTEGPYLDGRRPAGVAFSSPQEDAQRRDFTINGMFYDPLEQRVLDFVGGERDLAEGIVRAIGDPHDRVREDKLRMLRAVRFAATLEYELDRSTADAVREMAVEIHVVSAERIAQELKRMLVDRHRRRAMELARELGLLPQVLPELVPLWEASSGIGNSGPWDQTLKMLQLLQEPGFELACATLLHAIAEPGREVVADICRRLRLSNRESDQICWLVAHRHDLDDAVHLPRAKLKRLLAHRLIGDLLALKRVETLAMNEDLSSVIFCEEFLRNTPPEEIDPPALITGADLVGRGLKPGPQFKDLLETVRDAQLNGEIRNKQEALQLVDRIAEGR